MEYKVTLVLHLFNKGKTKFSAGYRELQLPFVPFVGLSVLNGAIDFGKIERISWIEEEQRFSCSIDYEQRHSDDDIEFMASEAKRQGYHGFDKIHDC